MRLPKPVAACVLVFAIAGGAQAQTACRNGTGIADGYFYTFWHDAGSACMKLGKAGRYRVKWQLGTAGNLVAGKGWFAGSANRVVGYKARLFKPGSNGFLSLYGWSTNPLVEYYVVDNWGGFTPPGDNAIALGTFDSDDGTYHIYRTKRIDQPSIVGTATFYQYWSVRTARRSTRTANIITFGNHVTAWRNAGLYLGSLHYQVIATEGFGSSGASDISVWEQ